MGFDSVSIFTELDLKWKSHQVEVTSTLVPPPGKLARLEPTQLKPLPTSLTLTLCLLKAFFFTLYLLKNSSAFDLPVGN